MSQEKIEPVAEEKETNVDKCIKAWNIKSLSNDNLVRRLGFDYFEMLYRKLRVAKYRDQLKVTRSLSIDPTGKDVTTTLTRAAFDATPDKAKKAKSATPAKSKASGNKKTGDSGLDNLMTPSDSADGDKTTVSFKFPTRDENNRPTFEMRTLGSTDKNEIFEGIQKLITKYNCGRGNIVTSKGSIVSSGAGIKDGENLVFRQLVRAGK